jgi:hypothetical protein
LCQHDGDAAVVGFHAVIQKDRLFLRQGAEKTYGAPTFCRLSDGGHSVTRLPRSDSTDSMSVIQQRAKCTRSDIPNPYMIGVEN